MCARFLISTAAVVLGAVAASAEAADEHAVTTGDRVRVMAPSASPKRIEGTLVSVDRDSLTVFDDGRRVVVTRSQIAKLEVARGKKSRAGTGALVGAGWGVGLGVLLSNPPSSGQRLEVNGSAVTAGVVAGATLGALVGVVLRTDRWTTAPADKLTLSIGPVPGRGVALAMRFSF